MKFVINDERLFHLLRHFDSIDTNCQNYLIQKGYTQKQIKEGLKASGSLFFSSFCTSPCQLPVVFSKLEPIALKLQENGNYAIKFISNDYLGTNGLIPINKLSNKERESIFLQDRGGIEIKVINGIEAPKTYDAHVIAKRELNTDNYEIITCFPGSLSPPFPTYIKDLKEREISEYFWEKHVLIEQ